MSSATTSPTPRRYRPTCSWRPFSIGLPFSATTTSPGRRPACAAGPPGSTSARTTPWSRATPRAVASIGVSVCGRTPMSPRRTRPCCADLFVDGADDVARGGEAEALAGGPFARGDEGVDADDAAAQVDERSAAAARADRRVALHVDHRRLGLQLPGHRAHDPERYGVVEPERAAERDHDLPGPKVVGIAEGQRRQAGRLDLDDGEVGLEIETDDAAVQQPPARRQDRAAGRHGRHLDADALRAADHVRVGHDEARGVDDRAGPGRPLRAHQVGRARHAPFRGRVGHREDLDHRRARGAGGRLDGAADRERGVGGRRWPGRRSRVGRCRRLGAGYPRRPAAKRHCEHRRRQAGPHPFRVHPRRFSTASSSVRTSSAATPDCRGRSGAPGRAAAACPASSMCRRRRSRSNGWGSAACSPPGCGTRLS